MQSSDFMLMLAATGILWLGALAVPLVAAGHGRSRLAFALGAVQFLFPALFGAFGFLLVQGPETGGGQFIGTGTAGFFLGWAIGVYAAAILALLGVAAILWPGPTERTLGRE